MDKLKQWVALTVLAVLAIGAGGWFLLISPKRSEASDVKVQVEQQVSANSALQTQIAMLKAQAKQLPQQQAKLAAVAAKIPDNPALPALVRALTKAADDTGVDIASLAPSTPVPVAAVAATTTVTPPVAGAAPAAGAAAAPAAQPATGGSAGTLQSIPLNVTVVGSYFQVEQFLDRVENLSRAMKITGFTLAPGTSPLSGGGSAGAPDTSTGKVLQATLNGVVYMATGRAATAATTATTATTATGK